MCATPSADSPVVSATATTSTTIAMAGTIVSDRVPDVAARG